MISFDNTEIAFRMKSDAELTRAYCLFRAIAQSWLVKAGTLLVRAALFCRLPMGWIIRPTVFRHFCGGITLHHCAPTVERLAGYGVYSILDYSAEGKETGEDFRLAMEETLRSIRYAAASPHIPFTVFKPTGFAKNRVLEKLSSGKNLDGDEKDEALAFRKRIDTLCRAACEAGVPILIDAEDFCYQDFIDRVVMEMMRKYNGGRAIVFNTFQMYRRDRLDYLKACLGKAREEGFFLGAKFVRGAYMEKERERARKMGYESPIHPDKMSTDKDYNLALEFSIINIDRIAVFNGSHNEESAALLAALMEKKHIARNDPRVWTSQLYGMSDHISFNMAHQGYNVAKYIPYGPVHQVIPYLIRRAEENTSVAGQTGRELRLLRLEKKRRKIRHHADK